MSDSQPPHARPAPSPGRPPWPEMLWTILALAALLILPYVAAFVIGGLTFGVLAGLRGLRGRELADAVSVGLGPPGAGFWIASIFAVALIIIGTQALARRRFGGDWRGAIGLRRVALPPWLLGLIVLLLAGYFMWATVVVLALKSLWPSQVVMPEITSAVTNSGATAPLAFVLLVVLAPVSEELLFRGYAFARLGTVLPRDAVIAATALGFALAHFNGGILHPLVTFYLGIATGWLRASRGSIVPGIILHGAVNSLAVAAMLAR